MFAGLRRGELRALRIEDVDLARGVIHVCRGWDEYAGEIPTKTGKDRRVPIAVALRDYLDEHLLGLDWQAGLVFGSTASDPLEPTVVRRRANRHWKAAKLSPITLHECRHTFASLMIAAGVNAKALSTYMGHAQIAITLDRYGHLMPGNEKEAAGMLDAYLERADTRRGWRSLTRLAQILARTHRRQPILRTSKPKPAVVPHTTSLEGTSFRGEDGYREWLERLDEAWESWEAVPEELTEIDNARVVTYRFTARSRLGVPIDEQLAWIITLRNGRLARTEAYPSVPEALKAVGLGE